MLQLVIYGIDGVLVPEEAIYPFDSELLLSYLTETLMPGYSEVPLGLIVAAVQSNQTDTAAEAALTAINGGYLQQLVALFNEATGNQQAILALAAVTDGAINKSSCTQVKPLLQKVPNFAELKASNATQTSVAQKYPALTQCASSSK